MDVAIWAAIGFIIIGVVVILASGRKKKWYKIYRADGDVRLMYRIWAQRIWANDKHPKFMDDNGHEFTYPADGHWILAWELIPDEEVDTVRQELRIMKETRNKIEEG